MANGNPIPERDERIIEQPALLYVIHCKGFHKIGIARDMVVRMYQLQCGNPFEIEQLVCWPADYPKQQERDLHLLLGRYGTRGEWFTLPPELLKAIVTAGDPEQAILNVKAWIESAPTISN